MISLSPLIDFVLTLFAALAIATTPVCPVDGTTEFSNDYGVYAKGRVHQGVDVFADRGTPAVAPESGRVTIGHGRKGGNVAWLDARDGTRYYFAHLDSHIEELNGEIVAVGKRLGSIGNTGNAKGTSPHLHLGVNEEGHRVSPYPLLVEACG